MDFIRGIEEGYATNYMEPDWIERFRGVVLAWALDISVEKNTDESVVYR